MHQSQPQDRANLAIVSSLWARALRGAVRAVAWVQRTVRAAPRFGWATVEAVSSLWAQRARLTWPVRLPWLHWLDRPLAAVMGLEPRLLSSRVAVPRVPFEGPFVERLKLWLWERHSVSAGLLLSVAVGIGMCFLAVALSTVLPIPMLGLQSDVDGMPPMIIATAAYLGALFGFLQAVTIFAVQLRSQQDTSMLPLTPLIARRYFTFFVLGSIAGVTIANLLAALAAPVLPINRSALAALSWFNLLAVPGATIAAFWYLAKIVSEAGEADMDVALPVLRATMRLQTRADALQEEMLNQYARCLEEAGMRYDPFAASSLRTRSKTTVRIVFSKFGRRRNLDCFRLKGLARSLRRVAPSADATISVTLGEGIQRDEGLILTWTSAATRQSHASKPPISEESQAELRSALAGVFLVRRGAVT